MRYAGAVASPAPCCPRCGYDQTGAIAAWERLEPAQCPLAGVCSECGLEIAWRDIFGQAEAARAGTFEHVLSGWALAFGRTLVRSLWPPGFWRWHRMTYRLRPARVLICAGAGVVLTYLVSGAIWCGQDLWRSWHWFVNYPLLGRPPVPTAIPDRLARWQWHASPIWWCGGPKDNGQPLLSPAVALGLLSFALMPVMYLLLPLTFRRYRVRRAHLWRIATYGWMWIPAFLWLGAAVANDPGLKARWIPVPAPTSAFPVQWRLALATCLAWQVCWWAAATKHYLKLPHAMAVAGMLTGLTALLGFALLFACWGGGWLLYGL